MDCPQCRKPSAVEEFAKDFGNEVVEMLRVAKHQGGVMCSTETGLRQRISAPVDMVRKEGK